MYPLHHFMADLIRGQSGRVDALRNGLAEGMCIFYSFRNAIGIPISSLL